VGKEARPAFLIKGNNMSEVVVNVSDFRGSFPEFKVADYPDALVQRFITMAEAYCSTKNFRVKPAVRVLLIELMTAHLITLSNIDPTTHESTGSGSVTGFETSASVGGVSVSLQTPIARNAFEQWINSTGYGQQYWALLVANCPTPVHYVGCPAWGIR
jgi:hypothetical protein